MGLAYNLVVFVPAGVVTFFGADFDSCTADDCLDTVEHLSLQAVGFGDVSHCNFKAATLSHCQTALHLVAQYWCLI